MCHAGFFSEIPPCPGLVSLHSGSPCARCCKQARFLPSSWDTRPPSHSGYRKCTGQLLFNFVCRNFILRAADLFPIRSSTFHFKKMVPVLFYFLKLSFYFTYQSHLPLIPLIPLPPFSPPLDPHLLLRECEVSYGESTKSVISLEGGPRPSSCI